MKIRQYEAKCKDGNIIVLQAPENEKVASQFKDIASEYGFRSDNMEITDQTARLERDRQRRARTEKAVAKAKATAEKMCEVV